MTLCQARPEVLRAFQGYNTHRRYGVSRWSSIGEPHSPGLSCFPIQVVHCKLLVGVHWSAGVGRFIRNYFATPSYTWSSYGEEGQHCYSGNQGPMTWCFIEACSLGGLLRVAGSIFGHYCLGRSTFSREGGSSMSPPLNASLAWMDDKQANCNPTPQEHKATVWLSVGLECVLLVDQACH